MANKIAEVPRLTRNGSATVTTRMEPALRERLIAISQRRAIPLNEIMIRAAERYARDDERRQAK